MRLSAVLLACLVLVVPAAAQQDVPPTVTAADYARAESFLRPNTSTLVTGATVRPTWLDGDRFWYRNTVEGGAEFILVDAARRSRERAFDHERLAAAVSREANEAYGALTLPFTSFTFSGDGRSILFDASGRAYTCRRDGASCTSQAGGRGSRNTAPSPDGTLAAFIRDYNLWVRDATSGTERQLTTDGIEDYGYATDNAGWTKSDRPVVVWSPDSKKIATFQHDARGVGDMYLVSTNVGHPTLEAWKYPLPGDSVIFRISRVVIDVETAELVRLNMPADPHRSTLCDHVRCRGGGWADVEWSEDGTKLAFVSTSRDHKDEYMRVANPETGEIRDVMEEHVETFFESGYGMVNWHMLAESNELIWYSQRDDWGHLYLYDLESGDLERQITGGDWNVLQLRRIDEDDRKLYFTGAGREPGDPYFQYFYSVSMDGGDVTLLTPDSANHTISLSPSGEYFVDSFSTPVVPPKVVVRDKHGRSVLALEEADISRLVAGGWQPPLPIEVVARDGKTDLHGLMYKPTNFDPAKKYPILNYVYPGPQTGSVGSRSFRASRSDKQAVAELGFIVVELDGMGTPMRSKSFHTTYYGNMGDNTLPDQIGGIRQLAAENPWMDLDRVAIWGHSGGGFAAAGGIMRYPDFYKVAVSQAGNHDNRSYEDDWGEKYQGLLEEYEDGTTNYDNQANQLLVENLKGKLLIAHGTMDDNVPPQNTMMLVNELIAANKDFDLILFPNRRHGFGSEPYMTRRRWDYFVKHLLGAEPPPGYEIGANRRPIS
ncbi:MAG: S9 family peptidase [Gemmatimonadota bacterium]|nr:MAG: S9 family peptidase [Gemmatimonadota bacterium]